jgi:hypothetical protein
MSIQVLEGLSDIALLLEQQPLLSIAMTSSACSTQKYRTIVKSNPQLQHLMQTSQMASYPLSFSTTNTVQEYL